MYNDVDVGAIREVVDYCLVRQKRDDGDFLIGVGEPSRYLVPISKNESCNLDEFVLQLWMFQIHFDKVAILSSLLPDGTWQMDVAIGVDDSQDARYYAEGLYWGWYYDAEKGEKVSISD